MVRRVHGNEYFAPESLEGSTLQRSLLGSAGQSNAGGAQQLLAEVATPQDQAKAWVVNMASMRFAGGILVNTNPPDTAVEQGNAKITIQWGVGGVLDEAQVDYPWAGGSFTLHAATVRVYAPTFMLLQSNNPAIFKAWIAPTGNRDNGGMPPTFTTNTASVVQGTPVNYPVPARARGYRPFGIDWVTSDATTWRFNQLWGGNNQVQWQDASNITPGNWNNVDPPEARNAWGPLHPRCSVLQVQQVAGASARNIGIQFVLDLG